MVPPRQRAAQAAPLFRFLARAGLRVAAREQIPMLAAVLGVAALLGDDFVLSLATVAFPQESPLGFHGVVLALLFLSVASMTSRRVRSGLRALRFLPAAGDQWRRTAWIATSLALLPLLALATVLLLVSGGVIAIGQPLHPFEPLSSARLVSSAISLPLLALTAAAVATTSFVRAPGAAAAAVVSWAAAATGIPLAVGLGIAALVTWDHAAGGLDSRRLARPGTSRATPGRRRPSLARTNAELALRALRFRPLLPWAAGLLPLGAAALFVRNNELPEPYLAGAERLGAACALALAAAVLADLMARHRPPWPWARSLPWSARRRVRLEATLIAAMHLPLLPAAAWITPRGLLTALCLLPFVALRAATQPFTSSRLAPGARIVLEVLPLAAACALLSWLPVLLLLSTPWWLRLAASAERDWRSAAWRELAHHGESDPLATSSP